MNSKNSIHFLITGGTIDSYYDGSKDTVVPNKESIIPSFIKGLKLTNGKFEFTTICMKDSREINDKDRQNILKTIEGSAYSKILITHGTYSVPDTARFLQANLKRKDQVIILTASMIPLNGFSPSDGPFHLGYTIAQLSNLDPGVYVCVNGHVFNPNEVMKDISEGRFTSIFNK